MSKIRPISLETARRLAVTKQLLHGHEIYDVEAEDKRPFILQILEQIQCLQLDPLNVVARTQLLVLWSRLGPYDIADLEALIYDDQQLFEYWAHAASIVRTANFPLHQYKMQAYLQGDKKWQKRVRNWLVANEGFRQYVKAELATRGPLEPTEIEDRALEPWQSSGWTSGRNVDRMLDFLWVMGEIMVARRTGSGFGLKKAWGLTEQLFPQWAEQEPLPPQEVTWQAAQLSLKGLGVGTMRHIKEHFTRDWYPELPTVMKKLQAAGVIERVAVMDGEMALQGDWFIHRDDLPLLEQLQQGAWQPRTVLLSPFDNLICDRARTELLFDFYYRSEIYTPKAKRVYGYYVMPLLHGERLVGRIDPKMERKTGTLHVKAVHWEEKTAVSSTLQKALHDTVDSLAQFLGATKIEFH